MRYFSHTFDFVPLLKEWTLSGDMSFSTKVNSFYRKSWSSHLSKVIELANRELISYNLPDIFSVNVFNRPAFDNQVIHIDHLKLKSGTVIPTCAAYNVPIKGNESSIMRWWGGDYELVYVEKEQPSPLPRISTYMIDWKGQPKVVDELKITQPHFVKVNEPHNVQIGNEDRILVSLRFSTELTMERAHYALSTSKRF